MDGSDRPMPCLRGRDVEDEAQKTDADFSSGVRVWKSSGGVDRSRAVSWAWFFRSMAVSEKRTVRTSREDQVANCLLG